MSAPTWTINWTETPGVHGFQAAKLRVDDDSLQSTIEAQASDSGQGDRDGAQLKRVLDDRG